MRLLVEAEGGDERLLRHLYPADLLHLLLAFLLPLEQLALPRDVAAVALGEHVLALRLDRLAGDDPASDRGLYRHVEELARDQLAQLRGHLLPVLVRLVAMHDRGERIDRSRVQQHVDLREVRTAVADRLVVEARLTPRAPPPLVGENENESPRPPHRGPPRAGLRGATPP